MEVDERNHQFAHGLPPGWLTFSFAGVGGQQEVGRDGVQEGQRALGVAAREPGGLAGGRGGGRASGSLPNLIYV